MKLKALKKFEYATRMLEPGDEFDCEDKHVQTLTVIGHAEEVKEQTKRKYQRRDMQAEGAEE
jgi:hypothetical protein